MNLGHLGIQSMRRLMVKIKCPHTTVFVVKLIRPAMVAVTMTAVLLRKRDSPKVSMGRTMTCWLLRTATTEYRVPLTVRLLVAFNPLRWRRCTPKGKAGAPRALYLVPNALSETRRIA